MNAVSCHLSGPPAFLLQISASYSFNVHDYTSLCGRMQEVIVYKISFLLCIYSIKP
ncbi:hypothetical protein HMPREF0262_00273 [Clostridium sp. ATCC 29733]|nr:hypothetical protein HMPREF0262_00273 [Clostridium sp. ATCC 29733]